MQRTKKMDFAKLLGFQAVGDEVSGGVDFQDDVIDAKLGAKVGAEAWVACEDSSEFAVAETTIKGN